MFDHHQMSYLIDISKQRRKEYTDAMDYTRIKFPGNRFHEEKAS